MIYNSEHYLATMCLRAREKRELDVSLEGLWCSKKAFPEDLYDLDIALLLFRITSGQERDWDSWLRGLGEAMARNERSPARAHAQRWVLTVAAVAMALGFGSVDAEGDRHKYCIVGAGPGGLQLGQLMLLARRDYVIYERNARPGSFFEKFPIHRKLISLNKRNTGRDNAEFNLRHDWNSLLGNPECLPVTNRTTDRFPHADTLVEYLRDFARPQETAGRIQYGVDVQLIARSDDGSGFTLDVRDAALQTERLAHCDVLIMANGLWTVNTPGIDGADLMTGYEELPSTGDSMEAKSIAIFGMGNSAFEVANAAADYVSPEPFVPPSRRRRYLLPLLPAARMPPYNRSSLLIRLRRDWNCGIDRQTTFTFGRLAIKSGAGLTPAGRADTLGPCAAYGLVT